MFSVEIFKTISRRIIMQLRSLIRDEEFLENMPKTLMNELILVNDPIPIRIRSMVIDYIVEFNLRRLIAIEEHKYQNVQNYDERLICRKLPPAESREYHNELALNFIRKYPQFKPIISHVRLMDENFNVLKEIPIDQYLAEN